MSDLIMKKIETELELREVLDLCYKILGERNDDLYGYSAWYERIQNDLQPLVYAQMDGKIVSAVLGRAENKESLVIGFVACDENYRRQGITKKLLMYFEDIAIKKGFQYITLGSLEDSFYEKCGYNAISQIEGQNVYQKKIATL